MAKIKKRSSAAAVPKSAIEQVSSTLKDLPAKPKENLSLREAVLELHDSITMALDRGYSYDEVVEILAGQEVKITVASLKRYLAVARKEAAEKPKRTRRGTRSRKAQSSKASESVANVAVMGEPSNGAAATRMASADSNDTSATKKRQTRTGGRAHSTPKTKTAAKVKPTSRAKTTSRSTSSRSRRKSSGASN
jgi:hypothetical protein